MRIASDHEPKWRDLFDRQKARMDKAALMVLRRQDDPKEVLRTAINQLKDRPFDAVFGPISAVREVIKAAIAQNDQEYEEQAAVSPQPRRRLGPLPLEELPWAERAVYFLHEIQHYARRDTGLLLGMSDWEVDQLKKSAKRRMGFPEESPEREFLGQTHPIASIRIRHSLAFAAYE